MNDRELLEKAAKAAVINGFWVDSGLNIGSDATPAIWNPLTDDGDALRLAIDAGIDIQNEATIGGICIASCAVVQVVRIHDGQIHKANRRAIFDAAVDMGKAAA